jgi:ketosteroid isomerase-like protein
MRLPAALPLALCAALAACRSTETPERPADAAAPLLAEGDVAGAAVAAELQSYYADFSARDWERFAAHFAPGAVLATVWVPPAAAGPELLVQTVPEFVAAAPAGPGSQPIFEERMTAVDIEVEGDLATARARYAARFGSPGSVAEWTGTDAFTFLRHGGRWRIVSLAFAADGDVPE